MHFYLSLTKDHNPQHHDDAGPNSQLWVDTCYCSDDQVTHARLEDTESSCARCHNFFHQVSRLW